MTALQLRTHGLIAAPFTPMHGDGSINTDRIKDYASWLIQESVKGAFICGTTGEGPSLTIEENPPGRGRGSSVALLVQIITLHSRST